MKKTLSILAVFAFFFHSTVFAGAFENARKVIGLGGLVDTATGVSAAVTDDKRVKQLKEHTRPVGSADSVIGVGEVVGTIAGAVGASGSGLMSTLAGVGSVVGGGAVLGLGVVGGAGGAGAADLMNEYLYDGETEADKAAQVGTYIGAGLGTVGGIAAVSTAGTAGLSAAGITSGLAGIGAAVGGGMVAGTAMVVAAPIAAAAVLGAGFYWLFKD